MELSDLAEILNGDVERIPKVDPYEDALFKNNTVVYPHNVKHMLSEFIIGKCTAENLNRWAEFLLLRGEYISPGDETDDELMDYYEDMWYVLQRLSTPEINGTITKERVKGYLAELLKYGNE